MVGTDGTWKQHRAEWLPAAQRNTDAGDFVEIIDGRARARRVGREPATTTAAGPRRRSSDRSEPPRSRSLYAQRTRITELRLAPASVTTLDDGAVVVDFGKIYAARPIVEFREASPGRTISMHVGYVLDPDGHVSTTPRHPADQPRVLLHRARRCADLRPLHVPGFPISRDRRNPVRRSRAPR